MNIHVNHLGKEIRYVLEQKKGKLFLKSQNTYIFIFHTIEA